MADAFFVNNPFDVYQNGKFYAQNNVVTESGYDYIFTINIASTVSNEVTGLSGLSTMNALFQTRRFKQATSNINNSEENKYNVELAINHTVLNELLYNRDAVQISSSMSDVTSRSAVYGTLLSGEKRLGLRFLEVVATKVFGHAKARAAIANDSDFYRPDAVSSSIINQVAQGMDSALTTLKNDIFNMYVGYDRVQLNTADLADPTSQHNDVDGFVNFNFENTNWEFPINFHSTVLDDGTDGANMVEIGEGPNVGGAKLSSGSMTVPILLRFHLGVA